MGLLDVVKGLLGGDTVQNALGSTGLSEHVEGLLGGDAAGVAESLGVDLGQVGESITGASEMLPGGLGDAAQSALDGAIPENPLG